MQHTSFTSIMLLVHRKRSVSVLRVVTCKSNCDLLSFKMYKSANKSSVSTSVSKRIRRGRPSTQHVVTPIIIIIMMHTYMHTHLCVIIFFFLPQTLCFFFFFFSMVFGRTEIDQLQNYCINPISCNIRGSHKTNI